MDLPELEAYLDTFINFERRPDKNLLNLHTMQILCAYFDHPESFCPCFHVAGSKGKGTIAANLSAIFRAAGYKTGTYLSPHVSHFTERIGTGAGDFDKSTYDAAFHQLKLGVDDLVSKEQLQKTQLTWFELVTIFAMLCFRIEKVDIAIYEVGMGGRLDTTNIITPICCCFGPIELEHTEYLGSTLYDIAKEKAGILKYKVPAISVPQPEEVKAAFSEFAAPLSTKVVYLPQKFSNYLSQDAEVARRAAKIFLPNLSDQLIDKALASVKLPGRFEIITNLPSYPNLPYLLIDVAHTPSSIRQVLKRIKSRKYQSNLLFGCADDKNVTLMAKYIQSSGMFKQIYLTRPGNFKKSDLSKIEQAFSRVNLKYLSNPDFSNFIPEVLSLCNQSKTPLTVLGSFYLAGEVKKCYNR